MRRVFQKTNSKDTKSKHGSGRFRFVDSGGSRDTPTADCNVKGGDVEP